MFQADKDFLTEDTIFYQMPRSLSYDIDTQDDFELCEFVMKKNYVNQIDYTIRNDITDQIERYDVQI